MTQWQPVTDMIAVEWFVNRAKRAFCLLAQNGVAKQERLIDK
jgi:hypothetical protein